MHGTTRSHLLSECGPAARERGVWRGRGRDACGARRQGAGPGRRGVAGAGGPPAPHRRNAGPCTTPHSSLHPCRSRLACLGAMGSHPRVSICCCPKARSLWRLVPEPSSPQPRRSACACGARLPALSAPTFSLPFSLPHFLSRLASRAGQVSSDGDVRVVSGVGGKGTSKMWLGKGRGLGGEGATRLAETMREAPPMMLEKLDIRQGCMHYTSSILFSFPLSLSLSLSLRFFLLSLSGYFLFPWQSKR